MEAEAKWKFSLGKNILCISAHPIVTALFAFSLLGWELCETE